MKRLLYAATLLAATWLEPAVAWKIDTHLWLADHLHRDLQNGTGMDLGRLGQYPVDRQIRDAISANRGAFLLGVLGPDIYPDMIAGQMTTHPGLPPNFKPADLPASVQASLALFNRPFEATPGWQTDDWLRWVRDRALAEANGAATPEVALAYGYLIHAAMDTWAHTYVNLYAGDTFEITRNQEVAARHVAIESFVKNVHAPFLAPPPPTQTSKQARREIGRTAGKPAGVLKQSADELTALQAPAAFVRRNLILHPQPASQYARSEATLHLWAMYLYWDEVRRLAQRLQPLKSSINGAFDSAQQAVGNAQEALNLAQQAHTSAVTAANTAYQTLQSAEQAALDATADLQQATNQLINAVGAITEQALSLAPPWMRTAYQQARVAADQANKAVDTARDEYDDLRQQRDQAQQALSEAAAELDLEQQVRGALNIARQQILPAVDGGVGHWRSTIEAGVDAYIRAWEETSKEIMRPGSRRFSPGGDVTAPLKQWVACWGPTFALAPPAVAVGCQTGLTDYSTLRTRLNQLLTNAVIPAGVRDNIEAFDHQVQLIGANLMVQVAGMVSQTIRVDNGVLAGSASFAVELWNKHITLDDLNAEFADDPSNSHLYVYQGAQSMAAMISRDMGVPANSHNLSLTDLGGFAPLQNSMTMARLTLLDGATLNKLATRAGMRDSVYSRPPRGVVPGRPLYHPKAPAGEVLIGALRSIDGNHQWQEVGPKLPRLPREAPQHSATCHRYGYPLARYANTCAGDPVSLPGKGGLRIWQDPTARREIFMAVFAGPVAPALCDNLGRSNLAPGIGCANDPFPSVIQENFRPVRDPRQPSPLREAGGGRSASSRR